MTKILKRDIDNLDYDLLMEIKKVQLGEKQGVADITKTHCKIDFERDVNNNEDSENLNEDNQAKKEPLKKSTILIIVAIAAAIIYMLNVFEMDSRHIKNTTTEEKLISSIKTKDERIKKLNEMLNRQFKKVELTEDKLNFAIQNSKFNVPFENNAVNSFEKAYQNRGKTNENK